MLNAKMLKCNFVKFTNLLLNVLCVIMVIILNKESALLIHLLLLIIVLFTVLLTSVKNVPRNFTLMTIIKNVVKLKFSLIIVK